MTRLQIGRLETPRRVVEVDFQAAEGALTQGELAGADGDAGQRARVQRRRRIRVSIVTIAGQYQALQIQQYRAAGRKIVRHGNGPGRFVAGQQNDPVLPAAVDLDPVIRESLAHRIQTADREIDRPDAFADPGLPVAASAEGQPFVQIDFGQLAMNMQAPDLGRTRIFADGNDAAVEIPGVVLPDEAACPVDLAGQAAGGRNLIGRGKFDRCRQVERLVYRLVERRRQVNPHAEKVRFDDDLHRARLRSTAVRKAQRRPVVCFAAEHAVQRDVKPGLQRLRGRPTGAGQNDAVRGQGIRQSRE